MPTNFSYPITFLPSRDLLETRQFYEKILKLPVALEQGKCIIFKIGTKNHFSYWGFCSHYNEFITPAKRVCLTLVVEQKHEVDEWHQELLSNQVKCIKEPSQTQQFKIYNSFYEDPMGYTIEIQSFDEDGKPIGV